MYFNNWIYILIVNEELLLNLLTRWGNHYSCW